MSKTESTVQDGCRLLVQDVGGLLLRNNSGAQQMPDGSWVRWGLGNDSKQVNKRRKSSDLIGVVPMLIQPHHVGRTVGIFTAIEAKAEGWKYRENDEHAAAQYNFLNIVCKRGGIGAFINNEDDLVPFIERFIL
jgi:hypothetical protein